MHVRTSFAAAFLLIFAATTGGRADDSADAAKAARPHHVYLIGNLRVTQPSLDLAGGAGGPVGAYLMIDNLGTAPDKLIGGGLDGGGTFTPPEADGLSIPPSGHLTLGPGTAHFTLADRAGLTPDGPPLGGTLRFEKAGVLHVAFARNLAAAADDDQAAPPAVDKSVDLAQ